MNKMRDHSTRVGAADFAGYLLFILVCLFLFVRLPHPAFFSGDYSILYLQARSLSEHRFRTVAVTHPGEDRLGGAYQDNDGFLLRRGEDLVAQYPPAWSALLAVGGLAAGRAGMFIPSLAALIAAGAAAALFFPRGRRWLGLAAVVSTPVLFYGFTLSAHAAAAALALWAALLLWRPPAQLSRPAPLLAGLACGLAPWFREETYWLLPALLLAWPLTRGWSREQARDAGRFVAGAAALLVPLWIFNQAVFGHPLGVHVTSNLAAGGNWLAARKFIAGSFLQGATNPALWLALAGATGIGALQRKGEDWNLVAIAAGVPALAMMALAMVDRWGKGQSLEQSGVLAVLPAAALAPLLFAARPGAGPDTRRAPLGLALAALLFAVGVTLTTNSYGGLQYGPRLLLPGLALLAVAFGLKAVELRPAAGLLLGLGLLAGVFIQGQGLGMMERREEQLAGLTRAAQAAIPADDPVVTDLWWAEQALPDLFLGRAMFYVSTRPTAERLLRALLGRGAPRVWMLLAPETRGGPIEQALKEIYPQHPYRLGRRQVFEYHQLQLAEVVFDPAR